MWMSRENNDRACMAQCSLAFGLAGAGAQLGCAQDDRAKTRKERKERRRKKKKRNSQVVFARKFKLQNLNLEFGDKF